MFSVNPDPSEQNVAGMVQSFSGSPKLASNELAVLDALRSLSSKARYLAAVYCSLATKSERSESLPISVKEILGESVVGPIDCFNYLHFRHELVEAGLIAKSSYGEAAPTSALLEAYVLLGRDSFLVCGGDPYEVFTSLDIGQRSYGFRLGHQGYLDWSPFCSESVLYPVFAAKEEERFVPTENLSLVLRRFLESEEYPRKTLLDQDPFNLLLVDILASAKNSEMTPSEIHSEFEERGITLPKDEFLLFMGPHRYSKLTKLSQTVLDLQKIYDRGAPILVSGIVEGMTSGSYYRLCYGTDEIKYAKLCGVLDDILECKKDEIEEFRRRLSAPRMKAIA